MVSVSHDHPFSARRRIYERSGADGYYAGGAVKAYVTPDFAVNGGIDYTRYNQFGGSNETDYTVGAEYLLSEKAPMSLNAGYTHSEFSGGAHSDTVFVGLRLYADGPNVSTLTDHQRSGLLEPHQFKF
jgi:hypothetical protein